MHIFLTFLGLPAFVTFIQWVKNWPLAQWRVELWTFHSAVWCLSHYTSKIWSMALNSMIYNCIFSNMVTVCCRGANDIHGGSSVGIIMDTSSGVWTSSVPGSGFSPQHAANSQHVHSVQLQESHSDLVLRSPKQYRVSTTY